MHLGSEKYTGIALAFELANQRSADPARTEYVVPAARLAEQTGLSEHTVLTHTKEKLPELANRATGELVTLYERRVRHVRTTDPTTGGPGEPRSQTTYVPTMDPLAMLDALAVAAPASGKRKHGHGGARFACPDHPSANVVKKVTYHCAACDRRLGEDPPAVLPNEQVAHPLPATRHGHDGETVHPAPFDVMVNEQVANPVSAAPPDGTQEPHPAVVDVYRVNKTHIHHNDELTQAPIAAAWLRGATPVDEAPAPPRILDTVRPVLVAADHAHDREERHRTNGRLSAGLVDLARSRGRLPVPKPPPMPSASIDAEFEDWIVP